MPGSDRARQLRIEGIVQGVGFRPFVARVATDLGLGGWVHNTGGGVTVHLEGPERDVETAVDRIVEETPPLASIDTASESAVDPAGHDDFEIRSSADAGGGAALVPPDTGLCSACLSDLRDPASPYHDYWATACVDCGPRFSVTKSLPYDRDRTAMAAFPLCADCRDRYEDRTDRRYHAQTTACPACGPRLRALTPTEKLVAEGRESIKAAADRLAAGAVVGIKGTGGTHLACDATDPAAVARLRERLGRPDKPFALMAPDLSSVESFAHVDAAERSCLTDVRRPIVTLDRHDREWLDAVAPGLHTVGVMLPYAGLHHLLFDDWPASTPLVVTSANRPGRPMATTTEGLLDTDALDLALVHDRDIVTRCDDSVVRVVDGTPTFLRRSRGWVPRPVARPDPGDGPTVLATGGAYDTTVAVSRERDVVPSQHVGDVDGPAGLSAHESTVDHPLGLLDADPDVVAHDAHPDFLTTRAARERPEQTVAVQHHHAHAAALLGEHDCDRAVVITADGTGYGLDGTVWGGEVLVASRASFERVGGLAPFGLPGGETAVEYPARILATLLADTDLLADRGVTAGDTTTADAAQVRRQAAAGVNCPTTTSAGRFLDAVAALLDVCTHRGYQGHPAMELEAVAADGDPLGWSVPYTDVDGRRCVDTAAVVRRLAAGMENYDTATLAATAQSMLGRGLGTIAREVANDRGLPVGLTGGVAVNEAIVETIGTTTGEATLLTHKRLPPGDGGLAYGQALVALARH